MKKTITLFLAAFILSVSIKANAQWVQTGGPGGGGQINCIAFSGTNIFAGTTDFGGVFLSSNNGTSWTTVNNGLTSVLVNAFGFSGTNIFAGTQGGGVFLSPNNGASWTAVNNGLTDYTVAVVAVSGTNIFAGTYGGVFLSVNNGTSWTAVNNGLTTQYVNTLTVSGTKLFAGTTGGVFLSANNGTSWTAVNNGLTNTSVYKLAVSGTNLFAGTYGGVFLSGNNGTNWLNKNQGFSYTPSIVDLLVANNYIFAGIQSNIIWRRLLSEIIGIKNISTVIPAKYSLSQNYPNPFNPTTKIKFDVVRLGDVKIVVYDVMGREVQTLVNESLQPGTYQATFNGSELSSGVYFYRLTSDNFTDTKRMLLVK